MASNRRRRRSVNRTSPRLPSTQRPKPIILQLGARLFARDISNQCQPVAGRLPRPRRPRCIRAEDAR
eukprot:5894691-Lingulodinium_polyedra.AAC.1